MGDLIVTTSSDGWQTALVKAYARRKSFTFVDDARLGIDPSGKTLLEILQSAGLTFREVLALVSAAGLFGWGATVLRAGLVDPEPYSKTFLVSVGSVMMLLPFGAAWRLLTGSPPGYVKVAPSTFKVSW